MQLEQEEVSIGGVTYLCCELSFDDMLPVLELDSTKISRAMLEQAVTVNGKPIGKDVGKMGFSKVKQLMDCVNRLNGLSTEVKS